MKRSLRESLGHWRVGFGAFAAWWGRELREAGEAVLARLAPRMVTHTLVRLEREGGSVWIVRGANRECLCRFTCEVPGKWPDTLQPPEAAQAVRGTKAVFSLAPEFVLVHKLTLPAAVERDLEQVIGLQLERECPMPLDRVHVDRRAGKRSREGGKFEIEVLIVQRDRVEDVRRLGGLWGLGVARIGVSRENNAVVGNFLQAPATLGRLRFTRTDWRLGVAALALAGVCAGVIAFQWGYERVAVGRKLGELRGPAAAADKFAGQLKAEAEPAENLVRLMRQPDALDVLTTLTGDVPKDSWIYDLDISAQWPQAPHVKLSGFTPVATMLVGLLQNTGRFDDVRLVSATSAGLGSGLDRLQLTARLGSGAAQ